MLENIQTMLKQKNAYDNIIQLQEEVSKEAIPIPFHKGIVTILFNSMFDIAEIEALQDKSDQNSSLEEII